LETKEYISESATDTITIIPPYSPLVCCIGNIGKFGFTDKSCSTNQQINAIVFDHNLVIPRYGIYLVATLKQEQEKYSNKTVVTILNSSNQGNILVNIPSLETQQKISNFLDTKISQLDSLISKKQELIKKLKEKRIALITKAVTKGLPAAENAKAGLDNEVPSKDSGIKWLGDIPQHWEVKRLRFLINSNPVKSEVSNLDDDIEVSFLPMEAINEYGGISSEQTKIIGDVYSGYTFFRNGDVVVAKITPCFENGKGTIVNDLINGIGFGTTELHVMRINEEIDVEYLFYLSISDPFRKLGGAEMFGAGGQKRVPEEFIKNFKIGFPVLAEQKQIVSFLNKHLSKLDKLISLNEKSITKFEEYRIALITNAVTGKLDLSNWKTDSEIKSEN
jgi:type I restriction enzyme S subunit